VQRVESSDRVEIRAPRCALIIDRLRPGVLRITTSGDDAGELGTAPHAEVEREIARFGPVTLLVDARGSTGVGPSVPEGWLAFIRAQGDRIVRVSLLVASRQVALAASSAAALAGVRNRFAVTSDAAAFDAEIETLAGPAARRPAPVPVTREVRRDGVVVLGAASLTVTVEPSGREAAAVAITGFDSGQLCAALFDELGRLLARAERWHVFLDARACTGVAGRAADAWAAWTRAHRPRIAALHVLATAPAVRLALGLEGEMAGMRPFLRVHGDIAAFERARAETR
jgi:hypothetical protein